jgi:hypothetical protein
VTHLRRIMLEELQRRHYSQATTQRYIRAHAMILRTQESRSPRESPKYCEIRTQVERRPPGPAELPSFVRRIALAWM